MFDPLVESAVDALLPLTTASRATVRAAVEAIVRAARGEPIAIAEARSPERLLPKIRTIHMRHRDSMPNYATLCGAWSKSVIGSLTIVDDPMAATCCECKRIHDANRGAIVHLAASTTYETLPVSLCGAIGATTFVHDPALVTCERCQVASGMEARDG